MDNRSILAIAMCVIFYIGYNQYMGGKYPNQGKPPASQTSTQTGTQTGTSATTAAAPGTAPAAPGAATLPGTPGAAVPAAEAIVQLTTDQLTLATDVANYRFSQELGALASVNLRDYKSDLDADARPVDLLDAPLIVQGTTDPHATAAAPGPVHAERVGRTIRFWRDSAGIRIAQEFSVPETGYDAALKVTFTNNTGAAYDLTGGVFMSTSILPKKSPAVLGFIPGIVRQRDQLIYAADNSTDWIDIEKFCKGDKDPPKVNSVPVRFAGIDRHYFLGVLEPKAKTSSLILDHGKPSDSGCNLTFVSYDRQGMLQPGETIAVEYNTYFGPKEMAVMKAHNPELESAIQLGTFGIIGRPLLLAIQGFYRLTHNYGFAVILMTICLKLLFYPLVRASSTSMHRMKKLNPEMQVIRDKFKDDKQRQQQELMKFMVAHKINPMKGCLPILPQIPVFFAFYQMLQTSIALRHAPFLFWIKDLSAMDPYLVTPLLMGVAMLVQQKLTPTTGMDKTQEKILMFMPVMMTVMMLTVPAGLALYMLTNTVVGISQQKWLYRRLDKLGA